MRLFAPLSLLIAALSLSSCSVLSQGAPAETPAPAEATPAAPQLAERQVSSGGLAETTAPEKLVNKNSSTGLTEKKGRPGFFARLFGAPAGDEESKPEQVKEEKPVVLPAPEQQAAAVKMLHESAEETAAVTTELPSEELPTLSTGGLRMRRFAPPEEAISSQESTSEALPNAVELHGLRSPELRGGTLPMDINGKITPNGQQD